MKQLLLLFALLLLSYTSYSQENQEQMKFDNLIKEADSFLEAGKLKQSIAAFTEALQLIPNHPSALYSRGMAYFGDKDFKNAIPDFTKLIELDSETRDEAYFMRGLSKSQLKDPEADGCADLKKAKELGYSYDWEILKMMCPNL